TVPPMDVGLLVMEVVLQVVHMTMEIQIHTIGKILAVNALTPKNSVANRAQGRQPRPKQKTHDSSQTKRSSHVTTPKSSSLNRNGKSPIQTKPKRKPLAIGMKDELIRVARMTAVGFVETSVAFAPTKEAWMPKRHYQDAGTAHLLGQVTRYTIESVKNVDNISVTITSTKFPNQSWSEELVTLLHYRRDHYRFGESWTSLCRAVPQLTNITDFSDEYEELDEQVYLLRRWDSHLVYTLTTTELR
ncbi:hypothetical protein GN958_ATG06679, partial [Phytophthora infestans]